MTLRLDRIQVGLLGGLALASPLQGYSYVPYLDVSFSALLLLTMVLVWVMRWRTSPVRTPWEYWWPVLGVLIGSMWGGSFVDVLAPAVAFVVTVQLVRSRERAEFLMWLTTCALGVLALCNVISHQAEWLPTAHSLYSQATFVGAYSVSHGVFLLILGLFWGGYLAVFSTLGTGLKTASFFVAFFSFGTLGGKLFLLRGHVFDGDGSLLAAESAFVLVTGGLLIWLVCRILAKLWVTRDDGQALALVLGGTLAAGVIYWASFPGSFAVYSGLVLGIAAGYALPDRDLTRSAPVDDPSGATTPFPFVSAVLVCGLIVVNAQQAYPHNERDSRNVEVALEQDSDAGDFDRLHRRASNMALVYPDQRAGLYGWMAHASIELGLHERASKEIAMAGDVIAETADRSAMERLDVAVIELRDAVSQSERANLSFAYERALVGMGEPGSALAVLKMKVDSGLANLPDGWSASTKAFVYAALLGDLALESEIAGWDSLEPRVDDTLWEGITVAEGLDAPLFWMVDRWPDRCVLYAVLGDRNDLSERILRSEWVEAKPVLIAGDALSVEADADPERAGWYSIVTPAGSIGSFRIDEGRLVRTSLGETGLEALPYGPVIRLHRVE